MRDLVQQAVFGLAWRGTSGACQTLNTGPAVRCRRLLAAAAIGGLLALCASPVRAASPEVPQYRVFETSLTNSKVYTDKFRDVILHAVFTSPSQVQTPFWGFYDGDGQGGQTGPVWKLRFMPWEPGQWSYQYSWSDGTPGGSGTFNCVTNGRGRGVLQPYALNPKWLAYNGREPVMLNEYYVGSSTRVDLNWTITNVYERLHGAGVNAVMYLGAPATDKTWDKLAAFRWSDGPAPQPRYPEDYHLDAWKLLEGHVGWLNDRDMLAYLWSGFWDYDESWVRYCCARLAPYANTAWNYRYEQPVPPWLLKAWMQYDPWNHLRGGQHHPGWADAPDDYTWLNVSTAWNTNTVAGSHADVLRHWTAPRVIPVVWNEGSLWHNEYLTDDEHMRRLAWGAVTAAGYFCWNWTCSLPFNAGGNKDNYDPNRPRAAAEILASNFDEYARILARILNEEVELGRLHPGDSHLMARTGNVFCLAEPGRQYLVYREGGGLARLTLPAGQYNTYWIDTRTGEKTPVQKITGNGNAYDFTAPNTTTDWVLIVKAPLRILSLGDSITQGNAQLQSFRYPLWKKLVSANVDLDFVGSTSTNYAGNPVWPDFNGRTFDRDHEGHWGWRADQILAFLNTRPAYRPDMVLLHAGGVDLSQGQDVTQTVQELQLTIDALRALNPHVKVLLAKLIPTTLSHNAAISEFNSRLDAMAAGKSSPASAVRVVDQFTGFSASVDTVDGLLPNAAGEEKMAQRWFDALVAADGGEEQVEVTISPEGGVYAAPAKVILNSLNQGVAIRYTTNDATPSRTNGLLYTGPIILGADTRVKAMAYKSGAIDSSVASADFTVVHVGALRKGINLGGPAVTIEGNLWLSDEAARAAGFSTVDATSVTAPKYSFPISPAPTTNELSMLQSLLYRSGTGAFTMKQTINNGTYHVYLWLIENYQNNFRAVDVNLEGVVVASSIGRLAKGVWRKYGPYMTTVNDGELTMRITPNSSRDPVVCGLAIFDSAPETARLAPPVLNRGQITLDWSGEGQLASAPHVHGPWSLVPQAIARPYSEETISTGSRFYRILSNP